MDGSSHRIARSLRARIDAGELGPGDRVPSVRALVRDWGVAHATAARAIDLLRRDGVVVTRARSGSVVARPSGSSAPAPVPDRAATDRDRIVSRALALADASGLAAVSLRALAAELGVPTMSLHRHVGGKDELVRMMIDAVFRAFPPPAPDGIEARGWRAGLEAGARRQWAAYRRHPWLAPVVSASRPQPIESVVAHAEAVARALETTDLGPHARLELHLILFGYVRGVASGLAAEAAAESDTGVDADTWVARADPLGSVLAGGRYPAMSRLAGPGVPDYPFDLDRVFEAGLRHLLDGFAVQVRAARRRAGGRDRQDR